MTTKKDLELDYNTTIVLVQDITGNDPYHREVGKPGLLNEPISHGAKIQLKMILNKITPVLEAFDSQRLKARQEFPEDVEAFTAELEKIKQEKVPVEINIIPFHYFEKLDSKSDYSDTYLLISNIQE